MEKQIGRPIKENSFEEVERILKRDEEVNKSQIINELGIHSYTLDNILKKLEDDGKILIAKTQTINDDKVVTQSINIKWIK